MVDVAQLKIKSEAEKQGARKALVAMAEAFTDNDDGTRYSASEIALVLSIGALSLG